MKSRAFMTNMPATAPAKSGVAGGVMGGIGTGYARQGTASRRGQVAAEAPATDAEIRDEIQQRSGLTRVDRERMARESKLAPGLLQVMKCLEKETVRPHLKSQPSTCKIGREGRLEVQVWLADKSAATLAQLKALGFEVVAEPKASRLLIGRVTASKLAALIRLDAVQYVAPQEAR